MSSEERSGSRLYFAYLIGNSRCGKLVQRCKRANLELAGKGAGEACKSGQAESKDRDILLACGPVLLRILFSSFLSFGNQIIQPPSGCPVRHKKRQSKVE